MSSPILPLLLLFVERTRAFAGPILAPRRMNLPAFSGMPVLPRALPPVAFTLVDEVSPLVAFADQAGNAAGPLFASSLFPYLAFLYFIRQDVNGLSSVAKAGFTTLLSFVFATVRAAHAEAEYPSMAPKVWTIR